MTVDDEALEHATLQAMLEMYSDPHRIGGATLLTVDQAPRSRMMNRVVGLGLEAPAAEAEVDAALRAMGDRDFFVSISPRARPAEISAWLATRGFVEGWHWMTFEHDLQTISDAPSDLTVRTATDADGERIADILLEAYGLPETLRSWLTALPLRPRWTYFVAVDGDRTLGVAGLHVRDGFAYLGFAGTLAAARGRGAQSALIAARLSAARERSCRAAIAETGERRADLPDQSYKNLLRAGFRERFVTENWRRASAE